MELTFACKRFPIDQVLRCSFALTNVEFQLLKLLLGGTESSVEDLARQLSRDRTTVQRAVKRLVEKGLLHRRQYNLDSGGYQYYYRAAERERIKEQIQERFEEFSRLVKGEIERW